MSSGTRITPGQIERWLLDHCQRSPASEPARCFARGPVAVRDNSQLFYAECTTFPSPIAVKLCLSPRTVQPDPDSAHRQYDALLRVSRAMGDEAEFSVPRPYLVRADVGLLATEWVAGESMTALVFSWHCASTQARQLLARAGRWLRCFHGCHALAAGRLEVDEKLAFLAEMQTTQAVQDPVFFHALARLRESAEAAAAITLERSWIHGDFKTDNLIVSGPRTVGVDIHLRHENVVIYDLAPFLNHLELALCHPKGWRLARCWALLRDTFLSNYFAARDGAIDLPLSWVQLYLLLQGWCTARTHAGSWLRAIFVDHIYRIVASRLVSRLPHGRAAIPQSDVA